MDFTVPWVPTGIKAGVLMLPWGVFKEPSLALLLLSFARTLKVIDDTIDPERGRNSS
jgi:hypothetical protein